MALRNIFPEAASLKLNGKNFCVCWKAKGKGGTIDRDLKSHSEQIIDETKLFRWQMESLGLMNVMNLDKNKEKWERYRGRLRTLPVDV